MSPRLPELGPGERHLLLTCARIELEPGDEAAVADLVREPLDWEAIVFFAYLHSVAPLLHSHLKRLDDVERVPAQARRRLLALAHRAAYQNRIFARENAGLVSGFDAAGVPVIVPKGITMVELVYGDLGLRPLIDLLFLMSPDRLEAAGDVMLSQRYRALRVRPPHAAYQWTCPQRRYIKSDASELIVLLKTQMIDTPPLRYRFTPERVREHARPALVTGERVLTPAPIDQVLYLCLQADVNGHFNRAAVATTEPAELMFAQWSNNRLIRFVDIREAVRHHRDELDWDRLAAQALGCGIEGPVHASLMLTQRLLGTTAPAETLEALSGGPPPRLRRALLGAVAQPPGRRSPRRAIASGWERLGQRRQKELFRLFALLGIAFPGLPALRAEDRSRSASRLLGKAALQAATTVSRSVAMLVRASVRRRGGARWPVPSWRRGAGA